MRQESQAGVFTWLVVIVATCLILFIFQKILWLVVPGLLALIFYYCLQPLVQVLVRAGLKHGTAAKAVAGVLAVITVLVVLLLLSIAAARATEWKAQLRRHVQGGLDFLTKTEELVAQKVPALRKSTIMQSSPTNPDAIGEKFGEKYLGVLLVQMLHWLPSLLLMPYLTYFLLQDGNKLKKRLIRSVPNAFFERTLLLVDRVDQSLQGFFVGLIKLTFLDTVCLAVSLWLLGISFPILLGLTAAVLAWLPYVGSVIGCVLVVLVSATDFPNQPIVTYGCILLFFCVRILDDFVFMPMTIGRSLQIHPVLSVLMLFLGAAVAGPTGLLLVLPVVGVVVVVTESLGEILTDQALRARFRHANKLRHRVIEIEIH
jgi:predicted PurR-regulated permease PerM